MAVIEALPAVTIRLGAAPVADELISQLVRLEVAQRVNAPATCELEFEDANGKAADAFSQGQTLSIVVRSEQRRIFEGTISAVELQARGDRVRTLRVLACDALELLRRGARVRTHSNVTFAELVRELTQPFGITSTIDAAGPVFPRLVQHRLSDFDVLVSAAERAGIYFWIAGTTMRSCSAAPSAANFTLTLGDDLREASVLLSDAAAVSSVEVCGWDPHVVSERRGRATRDAKASASVAITNVVLRSDREADAFARSQIERRSASTATLYAITEGNPELAPGACVAVKGVPATYGGPFRLTQTTHKLSPELGYVVELSSVLPPPHVPHQGSVVTLGIVADTRDPQHLGRVKVRYPAVADAESDWLQVLAAGAGGKKGLVALPSENDRVLVVGLDDDPAHGVVIGALYGQDGMPGDRTRPFSGYAFFSPGGHVIELDDDGALTLRTPGGTSLALGKQKTTLHSATDLRIEAPGQTISIGASAVEIERA